jgi:hypothetical protein
VTAPLTPLPITAIRLFLFINGALCVRVLLQS